MFNKEYIDSMKQITDTLKSVSDTMIVIAESLKMQQKVQENMIIDIKSLNERVERIEQKIEKAVF